MKQFIAAGETRRLSPADREQARGSFASLSAGLTNYELSGPADGETVLLVPGLTVPLEFWDDVIGPLQEAGYRTLTYSAYGRGNSDRVDGPYSPALFDTQLSELIASTGVRSAHVVASSMGAIIASRFALSQPDFVSSLTLSGPAGFETRAQAVARLPRRGPIAPLVGKRFLRKGIEKHLGHNVHDDADIARLRRLVLPTFEVEGTAYALLSTLLNFPLVGQTDLYRRVGTLGRRVQLLWGSGDQVTPPQAFDRAVELLQPERSNLVQGAGHMLPFERSNDFANQLISFIQGGNS